MQFAFCVASRKRGTWSIAIWWSTGSIDTWCASPLLSSVGFRLASLVKEKRKRGKIRRKRERKKREREREREMSLNYSTVDNVYEVEDQVSPVVYVSAAIALGFIGFFGFTMNLLVAVVIVKDAETLWTPVNVILVNLVVSY